MFRNFVVKRSGFEPLFILFFEIFNKASVTPPPIEPAGLNIKNVQLNNIILSISVGRIFSFIIRFMLNYLRIYGII